MPPTIRLDAMSLLTSLILHSLRLNDLESGCFGGNALVPARSTYRKECVEKAVDAENQRLCLD